MRCYIALCRAMSRFIADRIELQRICTEITEMIRCKSYLWCVPPSLFLLYSMAFVSAAGSIYSECGKEMNVQLEAGNDRRNSSRRQ